tara:strand:+ start:320 stop:634 length:315 start_codon:yes stop_codon:yes gene_type:complete
MIEGTFLLFIDAADDAACYPVERLLSITCASDATLLMNFESSVGKSDGGDSVTLTITADEEGNIIRNIIERIRRGKGGIIEIANDVTSNYIDTAITACAISLDS